MRRGVSQHLVVDMDDLISREELEGTLLTIADIRVDVAAIRARCSRRTMARKRKKPDWYVEQMKRSREFYELLERRRAERLAAERERAERGES